MQFLFLFSFTHSTGLDTIGASEVAGEEFPYLGAGTALTPAEEAVAERAAARSAAFGAAAKW